MAEVRTLAALCGDAGALEDECSKLTGQLETATESVIQLERDVADCKRYAAQWKRLAKLLRVSSWRQESAIDCIRELRADLAKAEEKRVRDVGVMQDLLDIASADLNATRAELVFSQSQRDDNENAWQCEKQKREAAEAELERRTAWSNEQIAKLTAERDALLRSDLRWAVEFDALNEKLSEEHEAQLVRYQRLAVAWKRLAKLYRRQMREGV